MANAPKLIPEVTPGGGSDYNTLWRKVKNQLTTLQTAISGVVTSLNSTTNTKLNLTGDILLQAGTGITLTQVQANATAIPTPIPPSITISATVGGVTSLQTLAGALTMAGAGGLSFAGAGTTVTGTVAPQGFRFPLVSTASAPYTVLITDFAILVTSGDVLFPNPSDKGRVLVVLNRRGSSGVSPTASSGTVDAITGGLNDGETGVWIADGGTIWRLVARGKFP